MDDPTVTVENLLAYCSSLALEFDARRNRVRHFIKHNLTSGTANEAILRDFLTSISAHTWGITDGFICNPIRGTSSKQCDILVHDRRHPLVYAESGVTVVWPESVLMLIEVKTSMASTDDLNDAIANIVAAKRTGSSLLGFIFAFGSLDPENALRVLSEAECEPKERPVAIFLFDQGAFIQQRDISNALGYGGGDSPYELHRCEGANPNALVLAYFLLLFLRIQLRWAPGFSSSNDLEMAISQFLSQHPRSAKIM